MTLTCVVALFAGGSDILRSQWETVEFAKPFEARVMAGVVRVGLSGEAAGGISIEECTKGWKLVLASTKTDESGHFSLGASNAKGVHYLRLTGPGMKPTLVRAKIRKSASNQELSLTIFVAT
jgi:hypothetical protein